MEHLWTPWRYGYVVGEEKQERRSGVPAALAGWTGDRGCVFCNMLGAVEWAVEQGMEAEQAEGAAYILTRGQGCFLVLNAFPYNSGHLMVVPYAHEASLAGLPLEEAGEMMRQARRAERALRAAYKPDGVNMGLNLGQAAGAGVADHLHLHVVPRWAGDTNFMSVVSDARVLPETLENTWKRLRAALAETPVEAAG
jgi:ATP adenylyltransferase